jgi:hypothetical protein
VLVALRFKVYVPGKIYWWVGFCNADVPPSPNSQYHVFGNPVDESVNVTVNGTPPVVGTPINEVTIGYIAIYPNLTFVSEYPLPIFFAVKFTLKVPILVYVCKGF